MLVFPAREECVRAELQYEGHGMMERDTRILDLLCGEGQVRC